MSTETAELRQLAQLIEGPIWDGDLINKLARDSLLKTGLIGRLNGWNFLTEAGVETLIHLGYLKPGVKLQKHPAQIEAEMLKGSGLV